MVDGVSFFPTPSRPLDAVSKKRQVCPLSLNRQTYKLPARLQVR